MKDEEEATPVTLHQKMITYPILGESAEREQCLTFGWAEASDEGLCVRFAIPLSVPPRLISLSGRSITFSLRCEMIHFSM